jgi:hypothetical protein
VDSVTNKSWARKGGHKVLEQYPPNDHEEQKEDALKDMMG